MPGDNARLIVLRFIVLTLLRAFISAMLVADDAPGQLSSAQDAAA